MQMLEESGGQITKLEHEHFEKMMEGKHFNDKCLPFMVPERKIPHEKLRSQLPNEIEPPVPKKAQPAPGPMHNKQVFKEPETKLQN